MVAADPSLLLFASASPASPELEPERLSPTLLRAAVPDVLSRRRVLCSRTEDQNVPASTRNRG